MCYWIYLNIWYVHMDLMSPKIEINQYPVQIRMVCLRSKRNITQSWLFLQFFSWFYYLERQFRSWLLFPVNLFAFMLKKVFLSFILSECLFRNRSKYVYVATSFSGENYISESPVRCLSMLLSISFVVTQFPLVQENELSEYLEIT